MVRGTTTRAPAALDEPGVPDPGLTTTRDEPRGARQTARSVVPPVILLLLILALWEFLVRIEVISPIIVAPPSRTATGLVDLFGSPSFGHHFLTTTIEALVGGLLGLIGGLTLGIASSVSKFLNRTLYPYVVFFHGLPKVVLAPVFVTWFGFGISSKIAMVIVLTFFPLYVNTLLGLSATDANAMSLMRSYGASRRDIFLKLQLPSALPSIFAGIKTSATFALIGTIVAEFLGARAGLGYLILQNNFQLRTERVYALIVVLAFMGLAVYIGVDRLYRKVVFWEDHDMLS